MDSKENLGFIGAGNMAQALSLGILKTGIYKTENIWMSAPSERNLKKLKELGFNTTHSNSELCANCDVIFLCVKPNMIEIVLKKLQAEVTPQSILGSSHLFVSVIAGISLATLQPLLPGCRLIRTMPNTPCTIGSGIVLYTRGRNATFSDCDLICKMLKGSAICEEVPEALIDNAGALSGCGPAFVFTVIQGLADGAVKLGTPRDLAIKLAAQTLLGSAKMVLETGKHPIELRDQVCSPGGSTIEGVHVLEKRGINGILMDAIEASAKKNQVLGNK